MLYKTVIYVIIYLKPYVKKTIFNLILRGGKMFLFIVYFYKLLIRIFVNILPRAPQNLAPALEKREDVSLIQVQKFLLFALKKGKAFA